jgi:peptide/nickel transport system substrate-binding protein
MVLSHLTDPRIRRAPRLFTAFVLLGAWYLTLPAQAQEESKYGGTVHYAERESVTIFNPYQVKEPRPASDRLFTLLYDALVTYDYEREEVVPALATDWSPRGDTASETITFQLRDGVTWHDGEPLTAEDVAFTFRYITQAGSNVGAIESVRSFVETVRAHPPDNSVTFELMGPVSQIAQKFSGFWIIPKHKFDDQMLPKDNSLRSKPVGTGAYKYINRTLDGKVILESYSEYWDGQAYVTETELRRIIDPTIMYQQATGGNIHLVIETPPGQIGRLEASNNFSIDVSPSLSFDAFAYDNTHPVLGKMDVRRAFTHAVNREAILQNFFADKGSVIGGPLVPSHGYFNPAVEAIEYNPEKARKLLDQAGYIDRDGDDTRETPQGESLTFELVTLVEQAAASTVNQNVAESYKNNLSEVGVEIKLRPLKKEGYINTVFNNKDFEIAWVRWEFDPSYDIASLFTSFGGSFPNDNIVRYENDRINELFRRFSEASDPQRRRSAINEAQAIIAEDVPYTFLYTVDSYTSIHYKLISSRIDPYYFFSYYDDWYVAPEFR